VARLGRRLDQEPDDEEAGINEQFVSPVPRRIRPSRGVIVEGLDDMLVRMARCCSPVPGDDIIGFVTVGRGVSVHRSDCGNIGSLEERAERLIEVAWAPEQSDSFYVWIQVEAIDRPRLLRDVTDVLSNLGGNIQASSSVTSRHRVALLRYELEISGPNVLERALAEIRNIDGVYDAYRLTA
jgi:GTP pyrophosphokinase